MSPSPKLRPRQPTEKHRSSIKEPLALPERRTEPRRTCVGCRQVKAQRELNRIGVADGQVLINARRISGRSAYLCSDAACWSTAEKRRAIDRALGVQLSAEDWARLRAGILN